MPQAKVLDEKELKKVIQFIDAFDRYAERNRAIILLTHYCGMRISVADFDALIVAKLDEPVFTTRLGTVATVPNLHRAFNSLLDELGLKTGADGRTRTLYSWRHFYATQDLERGVSTHALSRQLGNSTEMIDRHYSKYSPLLNAEVHSGRKR